MPYQLKSLSPSIYRHQKSCADVVDWPRWVRGKLLAGEVNREDLWMPEKEQMYEDHSYVTLGFSLVAPEVLPKKIGLSFYDTPLLDLYMVWPLIIVSERFRDLIEKFEPECHQFVQVRMLNDKGNVMRKKYYFLIIQQTRLSIDFERSKKVEIQKMSAKRTVARIWNPILPQ